MVVDRIEVLGLELLQESAKLTRGLGKRPNRITPAMAQAKTRDRVKERLVGEWQMTSLEVNTDGTFQRARQIP